MKLTLSSFLIVGVMSCSAIAPPDTAFGGYNDVANKDKIREIRLCSTCPCISIDGVVGHIPKRSIGDPKHWVCVHIHRPGIPQIAHRIIPPCMLNDGMVDYIVLLSVSKVNTAPVRVLMTLQMYFVIVRALYFQGGRIRRKKGAHLQVTRTQKLDFYPRLDGKVTVLFHMHSVVH